MPVSQPEKHLDVHHSMGDLSLNGKNDHSKSDLSGTSPPTKNGSSKLPRSPSPRSALGKACKSHKDLANHKTNGSISMIDHKDVESKSEQPVTDPRLADPLFDPCCDFQNPVKIHFEDISSAAYKLRGGIAYTPCTKSHMSHMTGMDIYFKKDLFQYTGSFKERGARNFLIRLSEAQKKLGVIATSAGNHALALSYHGAQLGIPVTVVMPTNAPLMKISLCKSQGANVLVTGNNLGESKEIAMKMARELKLTYCNGYDHPLILAGQGTMGLEILEQVPDMDAAIIPVGGGGLIAGVALALKTLNPSVQVIGVESEKSSGFTESMKFGKPTYTPVASTLADGLAVPLIGCNSYVTAAPLVDKMIVVKEEFIALAILRLIEMEKVVVEGAGAVGLAAVLSGQLQELVGKKVVIPLSGGNIDTTVLGRCIERGLAADGRLCRFHVVVSDRPGGIAELTKTISETNVSIKDIFHERAWIKHDVFSVAVTCVVETRDHEHAAELERVLKEKYRKVRFITATEVEQA